MSELFNRLNDAVRTLLIQENYDAHFATMENRVLVENRLFVARMEIWQEFHAGQVQPSVPMILFCPACRKQHVDTGEWATRAHSSHACIYCNHTWRPADVPTVGVDEIATRGDADDTPIRIHSGRGGA